MTSRTLDPAAADRLRKLCGMLGSEHDGERATAAAKADEFVRSLGLTWADVIAAPSIIPGLPRIRLWRVDNSDWRKMALYCHTYRWALSQRERTFIETVLNLRDPSEKQREWLLDIFVRVSREGAA